MKKQSFILILALLISTALSVQAQAPYKHSIGVTVGSMQAVSYKTFPTDHFAIQVDLGTISFPSITFHKYYITKFFTWENIYFLLLPR